MMTISSKSDCKCLYGAEAEPAAAAKGALIRTANGATSWALTIAEDELAASYYESGGAPKSGSWSRVLAPRNSEGNESRAPD